MGSTCDGIHIENGNISNDIIINDSDTTHVNGNDTIAIPPDTVIVEPELPTRVQLIQTFRNQIGVRQTNGNTGPEIDMYLASVGLDPGYPWCGAFASWGYQEHDLSVPETGAWTPSWFISSKVIPKEETDLADVGGIYFSNLGRIAHIVVFDEVWSDAGNLILTIEGNTNDTGSREGDGVYRKRRSKNQIKYSANWMDN